MIDTTRQGLRVAHLDCGRTWRGGQAQVLWLMEGLASPNVENLLLAPPGPLLERTRAAGIAARPWQARGDLDVLAAWNAMRLLRGFAPQVVHCHDARAHAVGVIAARAAGVPVVVVSRRVAVPPRGGLLSRLKYRLPVDRYLCVSHAVAATLRAAGVPDARLAIVPDGVPSSPLKARSSLRALAGVPTDAPVVVTVAALTPEKRHVDLLDAAVRVRSALPSVHFVWLGDGPCRADLERRREALGLTRYVHMMGFREDAASMLADATVAALASEHEGIGTSLIEAQSAGVPVVATRVGGIPEVVWDGGTGLLVNPHDPAALGAALLALLTSPIREEMSVVARARAAGFHIVRTVKGTLQEYRSLIAERGVSAA